MKSRQHGFRGLVCCRLSVIFLSSFPALTHAQTALQADSIQQTHHVRSAEDVESLIEAKRLTAGDTIVWGNGVFKDEELNIDGIDGTSDRPVILRAATPGGVILRGETQFRIGAQWWQIQGFHFDGIENEFNAYNTIQFRSNGGTSAQHVRLTDCAMTNLSTVTIFKS